MRDDDIRYWCEMAEAIAWREMIVAVQEQGDEALRPEWAEVGGAVAFLLKRRPSTLSIRFPARGASASEPVTE